MASYKYRFNQPVLQNSFLRKNDIETDSKEINELLLAAKNGKWQTVWRILGEPNLPRKGYLINVIPEGRRWGVLHQAIFWKSTNVLKKLLSFESCDQTICTKESRFKDGSIGTKDPKEIVAMYGCAGMLSEFDQESSIDNQILPTYIPYEDQEKYSKCFIFLEVVLAAYKQAFHPSKISPVSSIYEIMEAIFTDFNRSSERFESIKAKVCASTKGEYPLIYETLEAKSTPHEFCSGIIYSYTVESAYQLYARINRALRRQTSDKYQPTAKDYAIGPFVLMFQTLLLYWDGIEKESRATYRRMKMQDQHLLFYQVGKKFIWPSVTSSTVDVAKTHAFPTYGPGGDKVVEFTIDNSTPSRWQPRNIEPFACYREDERTYPGAAPFQVTKRETRGNTVYIHLKLLARW